LIEWWEFSANVVYKTHTNGYTKILTFYDTDETEEITWNDWSPSVPSYRMSIMDNALQSEISPNLIITIIIPGIGLSMIKPIDEESSKWKELLYAIIFNLQFVGVIFEKS